MAVWREDWRAFQADSGRRGGREGGRVEGEEGRVCAQLIGGMWSTGALALALYFR